MKYRNRRRWRIIRDYSIGWTVAFIFLCIVRGVGTVELGSVQYELWRSLLMSMILGPIFGTISGYAQVIIEERAYKRFSMRQLLLFRLLFSIGVLLLLILFNYLIVSVLFRIDVGLKTFMIEPGSFAIYFYILTIDLVMAVLRQVNLMLGDNNLGKLLSGKFYTPREEVRVFMFLDLQSSTQLAEQLGHLRYSRLLQDCFNDLGVVVENEAEIYQYVGDEAILTWKLEDGLRNQNCINAYFNFKRQLQQREDYYLQNYGCVPFFKAGLNAGLVTVTEVGKYKKEIAYHGDTMNTAARIQGKCNDLNQELLISENLKDLLNYSSFEFDKLGSIPLKGKAKEVPIYAAHEYAA